MNLNTGKNTKISDLKSKKHQTFWSRQIRILKSLWNSLLLILLPTILACLLIIPLIINTKATDVEISASSNSLSFILLSGWKSGNDVELISSITISSIRVWIDSTTVSGGTLYSNNKAKFLINGERNFIPHDSIAWMHLKSDKKNITLRSLYIDIESGVRMTTSNGKLTLEISPNNRVNGEISLTEAENIKLTTYNYKHGNLDSSSQQLGYPSQERFELNGERIFIPINSNRQIKIAIYLDDIKGNDFTDIFSKYLKIKNVSLIDDRSTQITVPLIKGRASFRGMNREEVDLHDEFIEFAMEDLLDLVSINIDQDFLQTSLSGKLNSLLIGKTPNPKFEILPIWLEWIYKQQQLAILIGALTWLSGTILGAVKLLDALRKTGE